MNTLASYRYQMAGHKKSILVFYLVIIAIYLVVGTTISFTLYDADSGMHVASSSLSGMEMTTLIFLFVVGLCTFKETFLLSLQNGISRKTLFAGKIMTIISVAAIMSLIDKILYLICTLAIRATESHAVISTLYENMYFTHESTGTFQLQLVSFLFEFVLALAAMAFGYFITIMFYRLNKTGKVVVGAGVPVFCFIVLPILDLSLFSGKITLTAAKFMAFACGTPSHMFISTLLAFVIFSAAAYLLMRRAVIKR